MSVPKGEQEMKAAVDHAYAEIGKAIDGLRAECDRRWLMRKLAEGFRITADTPNGPDPAWTFDCCLRVDDQPTVLCLSVPCNAPLEWIVAGTSVSRDVFVRALRERLS